MEEKIICPICKGNARIFYVNRRQPIFSQGLLPRKIKKFMIPRKLSIAVCQKCLYVFSTFRDSSILNRSYEEFYSYLPSDLSPLDVNYKKELVDFFLKAHGTGKVLEIGSHDGYFLYLLSKLGWDCVGIDPSPISEMASKKYNFPIIKDYFPSDLLKNKKFDFVIARHVLEHMDNPTSFLLEIKKVMTKNGKLFIEVPNLEHMVKKRNYHDFYFEHLSYFTKSFLSKLISACGFEIINIKALRGDRVIGTLAQKVEQDFTKKIFVKRSDRTLIRRLVKFGLEAERFRTSVLTFIENSLRKGNKWVIWGAGSAGINMTNFLGLTENQILFAMDSDPKKWDKYFPGNGIMVKSPKTIEKNKVDIVFIISGTYQDEIEQSLDWFVKDGRKIAGLYPRMGYIK